MWQYLQSTTTGEAGRFASDLAVTCRAMSVIYANLTAPNLRLMSGPSDLPYLKQLVTMGAREVRNAQQSVYLGGRGQPQQIPDDFGLRSLWGELQHDCFKLCDDWLLVCPIPIMPMKYFPAFLWNGLFHSSGIPKNPWEPR
jgi:hypothetical protein